MAGGRRPGAYPRGRSWDVRPPRTLSSMMTALAVELDGVERLRVTDASAAAIGAAGYAGLWTYSAGVSFDDLVLRSLP